MKKLILGSKSPRRSELIGALGFEFTIRTKETDESYPADMSAKEVALFVAKKKADALRPTLNENEVLLCADTVVILNDRVLGKPKDMLEAKETIQQLSGKTHSVITGIVLQTTTKESAFSCETKVVFGELSEDEINRYIRHFKPFDKAGSYGIQEWIGHAFIERIEGSYNNVVGLPTHEVYKELQKFM
jgi:septum formation protein